jgi:hypothetical protein
LGVPASRPSVGEPASVELPPASQLAHGVQATAPPSANVPVAQAVQDRLPASDANVPASQGAQVPSLVAEHAAVWCEPGPHTVQAWHVPLAVKKAPDGQVAQALGPDPEQVEQVGSHDEHCVSVVVVHAAEVYVPAAHVSQSGQVVPLRYLPEAQARQSVGFTPVQLVQDASHAGRFARTSGTSSTRMNV